MTENITAWDYCHIEYQLLGDGRDFTYSGPKQPRFRFLARATGPNGNYLAGQSEKVPLTDLAGESFTPKHSNIGHSNTLQILLETLQKEGWELMPEKEGAWWKRRLRRPSRH